MPIDSAKASCKAACPFQSPLAICHPLEKPLQSFNGHIMRWMQPSLLSGSVLQIITRLALIALYPFIYIPLAALALAGHLKAKWNRVSALEHSSSNSAPIPQPLFKLKLPTIEEISASSQKEMQQKMGGCHVKFKAISLRIFVSFNFTIGQKSYSGSDTRMNGRLSPLMITECKQSALQTALDKIKANGQEAEEIESYKVKWVAILQSEKNKFNILSGSSKQSANDFGVSSKNVEGITETGLHKIAKSLIEPMGYNHRLLLDSRGNISSKSPLQT